MRRAAFAAHTARLSSALFSPRHAVLGPQRASPSPGTCRPRFGTDILGDDSTDCGPPAHQQAVVAADEKWLKVNIQRAEHMGVAFRNNSTGQLEVKTVKSHSPGERLGIRPGMILMAAAGGPRGITSSDVISDPGAAVAVDGGWWKLRVNSVTTRNKRVGSV